MVCLQGIAESKKFHEGKF